MEKYLTPYTASQIKEIMFPHISGFLRDPSLLFHPKFQGEITETKIEIDSMESSPTFIRGTIRLVTGNPPYKSEVTISIDSVDNEKMPLMLIYVFSYIVIAIVFMVAVIKEPTNIWIYIYTLLACFLPIPIVKIYSFFESTPPTPEKVKQEFLRRIKAVKI
ncbi:MAG: hypothetical protein V4677_12505 [Bacteroidota bacterium]